MGNYKDRSDLLKNLCVQHPGLRHGAVENGKVRKTFYKNMADLTATNINTGAYKAVVMGDFTAGPANGDWIRTRINNEWYFLDKVRIANDNPSFTKGQDLVYDTMEKIMLDFVQRIVVDNEDEGGCGLFRFIERNSFRWEKAGPYADNYFGWVLRFSDQRDADPKMDFLPENYWLDVETEEVETTSEIIPFANKSTIEVSYTPQLKAKFGEWPSITVWVADGTNNFQVWAEFLYDVMPNPNTITVKIAGPASGFIKLGV